MQLLVAGRMDRVGGCHLVIELFSCGPIREVAVRQLRPERARAVAVHHPRGSDGN